MTDLPTRLPNPTLDPADVEAEPDAPWNQPLPIATRPTDKLSLMPRGLTETNGWFRSATFTNVWFTEEVWYNYTGTILWVRRPLRPEWLRTWRDEVVHHEAWPSEPDADGARNTERIFAAEAWVWANYVREVRGL